MLPSLLLSLLRLLLPFAELVYVATTPALAEGVSAFNSLWVRLVQSGSNTLVVNGSGALQDHCTAMTVALLTMHLSAAAVSMYLAYISQWVQVRAWLRQQAVNAIRHTTQQQQTQQQQQAQQQQQQQQENQRASLASPREVCGVPLTPRQLAGMRRSHAATLLLDGRGLLGHASMACFHACAVNLILLGVLLLSRLLVLVVGPQVLPGPLLRAYYPLALGLGGGVCRPEDEPQLSGFWGGLLFLLGV
jgi:membrane protein implicated in regulation of membrane protease activity